jgi:hypothetical protein
LKSVDAEPSNCFPREQSFSMTLTELLESVRRVEMHPNRLVNDTMVGM